MAVDTRRIAETARLAASPIGRFALGPRRGRARRPLASSSKRRRHLAASFRNLELSFAPSPADRACAQLGARIEQPSSRSLTVSCRGLVIRAKGGDAILSAAGSARRAFAESRDGTRGLWPPPLVEKGLSLGRGAEEGAPIEYRRRASKRNRRGKGEELLELFEGVFRDGEGNSTSLFEGFNGDSSLQVSFIEKFGRQFNKVRKISSSAS